MPGHGFSLSNGERTAQTVSVARKSQMVESLKAEYGTKCLILAARLRFDVGEQSPVEVDNANAGIFRYV
jgi:hypothetical protein